MALVRDTCTHAHTHACTYTHQISTARNVKLYFPTPAVCPRLLHVLQCCLVNVVPLRTSLLLHTRTAFSVMTSETPTMCKDHTILTGMLNVPTLSRSSCLASPTPDRRAPHTPTGRGIERSQLTQGTKNCLSSGN